MALFISDNCVEIGVISSFSSADEIDETEEVDGFAPMATEEAMFVLEFAREETAEELALVTLLFKVPCCIARNSSYDIFFGCLFLLLNCLVLL